MSRIIAALVAGTVFGLGLVVSGMTEPGNVIGFLRLGEGWNVALILVMASALTTALVGYRLFTADQPLFDSTFHAPTNRAIDQRLLLGAALFGLGWGVSGYCPGPAVVGAFLADTRALYFMVGFGIGVAIYEFGNKRFESAGALADG